MEKRTLEVRDVVVGRTNGTGFQSATGEWLNISKYADPGEVPMPRPGERVRVGLDKSGFVRKVESLDAAPPVPPAPTTRPTDDRPRDRDGVVTRLAVLNTATAILGSAGRAVSADDVIQLAARLEAWATR